MLTPKRHAFVQHYILTSNSTEAAKLAGYSARSARQEGSRLLTNADIREAVEAERSRLRERSDLEAKDVLAGLRKIAENENAPHSARVSSWKLLGQHFGLFDERLRVEHTVDDVALAKFSLDELLGLRKTIEAMAEPVEVEMKVLSDSSS
ncbi:terminase small subunit [SAR202 cluster bacterium AD-812-D07_MRT_10900m]|nr:terminase small subunit [SAR202 cluster bacterium AD-812-D07_MRT_10900m]